MNIIALKVLFFRYILMPLIVIILAVILTFVRKKLSIKNKTIFLYILISALCLAVPGFLGFSGNQFSPALYVVAMIIYLILGVININLLQRYFKSNEKPVALSIFFESMITIICMLLGAYFFYLIFSWMSPYPGYAFMASTCIFIFVIPLSFYYCYVQMLSIPPIIYATWQPNLGTKPVEFERIVFNSLIILNLEVSDNVEDGKRSRIQAKAPDSGVSFGNWFYRVTDDYNYKHPNATIKLEDNKGDVYSWIFYTKKSIFHLRKFIDFDKTIAENGITENNIIICKRVTQNSEKVAEKIKDTEEVN
jgi:hypothetical protein